MAEQLCVTIAPEFKSCPGLVSPIDLAVKSYLVRQTGETEVSNSDGSQIICICAAGYSNWYALTILG